MTIELGQQAPDFTLPHKPGGDPVTLSEVRADKNVVLLFFPLAWSPVCTTEMCTTRDTYSQVTDLDAEVLGISVDSPFTLQAWAEDQGFQFPLLSDFNKEASKKYGVLYEDLLGLQGVAKRAAFVVDKSGKVRYAEVCPTPKDLPDLQAIREILQDLG
jgi:peroxiredoxin